MNKIFKESAISVGKIIVAVVLIWFTYLLFVQKDMAGIYFGLVLLVFVTLPTIFVVYFKTKFNAKHPKFSKAWKFLRFIYALIVVLFVVFLTLMALRAYDKNKTQKAIEFINSQKITLNDVMGKNLPPVPDQKLNDSTIAGIDANKNGIRDDVELAIFKEYPNSAKIRAAELQYAQALQLELTQVFDSETLVAVMQKEDYATVCIGKAGPKINPNDNHEKITADFAVSDNMQKEVENLVLNTELRKKIETDNLNKYMAGYASPPGQYCDTDFSSLPN